MSEASVKRRKRSFLIIGKTPKGTTWIGAWVRRFRQEVTDAVMARHGELDLYLACLIQTASRWEQGSLLATRHIREEWEKMNHADKIRWLEFIGSSSQRRDGALRGLGLDTRDPNVLNVLYSAGAMDGPGGTPGASDAAPGGADPDSDNSPKVAVS